MSCTRELHANATQANVYHALTPSQPPDHLALKIYKTSILVFKDRDRYAHVVVRDLAHTPLVMSLASIDSDMDTPSGTPVKWFDYGPRRR